MGMSLDKDELLPGENIVLTKNVNAIIRIEEHGLSRFAFDHVMKATGLRGAEAIGGQLHLTNYRLVFKSSAVNRVKGVFSIFLPTLREVRNTSSGVKRQIGLATGTQRFTFIVWGIPALIAAIEQAKASFDHAATVRLAELASEHRGLLGEGLQTAAGIEALNRALSQANHPIAGSAPTEPGDLARDGVSLAGLSSSLNLTELQQLAADGS